MPGFAGRALASLTSTRALGVPGLGSLLDRLAASAVLPDSVREPLARNLSASWSARDRSERGEQVLTRAASSAASPSLAAALRAASMGRALDRGRTLPDDDVRAAVEQCLARADAEHARGDDRATRLLAAAAALTFHRQRHLAGAGSPFATPDGVRRELSAYRGSRAWAHLTRSLREAGGQSRFPEMPRRLAVLHDDDPRFIEQAVRRWVDAGVDVRVIGVRAAAEAAGVRLPTRLGELVEARWHGPADTGWTQFIRSLVGDADLVWHEWAQRSAVLASLAVDVPLVVRAHSFEYFTAFPHLIDPAAVSGLVTVSEPMQRLGLTVVEEWQRIPWAVTPPEIDPAPFARPKLPGAAHTCALVGWAAPDKDVVWALDLLAELRRQDDRWRMRLIGEEPDEARWPDYARRVRERLVRPDVRGAVDLIGHTDSVAEELRGVGVGLSSSMRESFHVGLAELAASGALPVVRNWPTMAAYGGASGVWPGSWVVETPAEGAARILEHAHSDRTKSVNRTESASDHPVAKNPPVWPSGAVPGGR